jgi:hypothetical protein
MSDRVFSSIWWQSSETGTAKTHWPEADVKSSSPEQTGSVSKSLAAIGLKKVAFIVIVGIQSLVQH